MRRSRAARPLSDEQRRKDNARSYAGVYLRRGRIVRRPCRECGDAKAQMHHDDYDRPLEVTWLCRKCHLRLHADEAEPVDPGWLERLWAWRLPGR